MDTSYLNVPRRQTRVGSSSSFSSDGFPAFSILDPVSLVSSLVGLSFRGLWYISAFYVLCLFLRLQVLLGLIVLFVCLSPDDFPTFLPFLSFFWRIHMSVVS